MHFHSNIYKRMNWLREKAGDEYDETGLSSG